MNRFILHPIPALLCSAALLTGMTKAANADPWVKLNGVVMHTEGIPVGNGIHTASSSAAHVTGLAEVGPPWENEEEPYEYESISFAALYVQVYQWEGAVNSVEPQLKFNTTASTTASILVGPYEPFQLTGDAYGAFHSPGATSQNTESLGYPASQPTVTNNAYFIQNFTDPNTLGSSNYPSYGYVSVICWADTGASYGGYGSASSSVTLTWGNPI